MNPNGEERRTARRRNERDRIDKIDSDYRWWARRTLIVLSVIAAVELALAAFTLYIYVAQNTVQENNHRIDRIVCAEVHYLERGRQITAADPKATLILDELDKVLAQLRPIAEDCAPTEPIKGLPPAPPLPELK